MSFNEVVSYVENMSDIDTAKCILESLSYPDGYYEKLYNYVCCAVKHNVPEEDIKFTFERFEEHRAIKHFQYMSELLPIMRGNKIKTLLTGKKPFIGVIYDIHDMDELKRYLHELGSTKDCSIDYSKYVPKYKSDFKR